MWFVLVREKGVYCWEAVFASRSLFFAEVVGLIYSIRYIVDVRYRPNKGHR